MFYIISWFLIIEILGILFFPITALIFSNLSDKGYSISKPFGILILGFISWICSSLYIFPMNQVSLSIVLLIITLPSIYIFFANKTKFISFFNEHKNIILLTELLWILVFILWLIYRSFDPSINHTEQPMDHGLLTSSIQTTIGVPKDIWLSSHSVNYYYFGYWIMGAIAKISHTPPHIAYNLALVIIPALTSSAIFGLLSNISRSLPYRKLNLLIIGLSTFIFVNISSNLEPTLELLNTLKLIPAKLLSWIDIPGLTANHADSLSSLVPQDHWWWWRASRVINSKNVNDITDYTIQEFPAFSFLIGDLHPHVMALPFLLIFIAFCWNILKTPKVFSHSLGNEKSLSSNSFSFIPTNPKRNSAGEISVYKNAYSQKFIILFFTSILFGSLSFINIWDFPVLLMLLTASLSLWIYQNNQFSVKLFLTKIFPFVFVSLILAFVIFFPYFGNLSSSIKGLGVVETTSRPIHIIIVWGVLITPVIPFILITFYKTKINSSWKKLVVTSSLIALMPYFLLILVSSNSTVDINIGLRIFQTFPITILIGICIYTALWETKFVGVSGKVFILIISSISLGLILGSELLYIDDLFTSSHERMNTLFKLYYQAGILTIISASFSLIYGIQFLIHLKGLSKALGICLFVIYSILFCSSLYYTPATISSKIDLSSRSQTLDGLEYLNEESSEYEVVLYLLKNSHPEDILLEFVGEWANAGLISRSTGVPNVLNWPGHEMQWRGEIAEIENRQADIRAIFLTTDIDFTKSIMTKYGINYVYIGPRESKTYNKSSNEKFAQFMKIVVDSNDSKLYYWEN